MTEGDLAPGFSSKPTLDTAPATCQRVGCDIPPKWTIRYINPDEYLCFCDEHSHEEKARAQAKYRAFLRP